MKILKRLQVIEQERMNELTEIDSIIKKKVTDEIEPSKKLSFQDLDTKPKKPIQISQTIDLNSGKGLSIFVNTDKSEYFCSFNHQ